LKFPEFDTVAFLQRSRFGKAVAGQFEEKKMQSRIVTGATIAAAAVALALAGAATPTPAAAHSVAGKAKNHCKTHAHCRTHAHCKTQKAHCKSK
jgi:hypothetical protein